PLSEVHLVEVAFQDLVLCEPPLDLHGEQQFGDLSLNRLRARQEEIPGQLLRNRAAPLGVSLLAQIPEAGPHDSSQRNSMVPIEVGVLGVNDCPLEDMGNLGEGNALAIFLIETRDELPVGSIYACGLAGGRIQRIDG